MTEQTIAAKVAPVGPQHQPQYESLSLDEYQALCYLRQLKNRGVEFAVVVFRERRMKVRRVED